MARYLLTIQQPDGEPPPDVAERLPEMARDLDEIINEMKQSGAWVFNGGLHPPSTATVLRTDRGEVVMTDGPYAEGKEHIGGLVILDASDLDVALRWGRRLAEVIGLPIEVRPFAEEP
jgi:hypothetical protein